jgi:hypothetical protein
MYQDHRDISSEAAQIEVSSAELLQMFKESETPSVLDGTVQVSGTVTEFDANSITLDNNVHCSFDREISDVQVNDQLVIKGRCIGYDELFELVKLDQSTIIK